MKTQSSLKEQWPESYLSRFNAFTSDTQSRKHIEVHVQRCIESGVISTDTTVKVVDICSANGTAGKIVADGAKEQVVEALRQGRIGRAS